MRALPVGLGRSPEAESRIGSVPGHTEDPCARKRTLSLFSKLTVERRSGENINFIVQGSFVEAGLVSLRILRPLFPSTENINKVIVLYMDHYTHKTPRRCV